MACQSVLENVERPRNSFFASRVPKISQCSTSGVRLDSLLTKIESATPCWISNTLTSIDPSGCRSFFFVLPAGIRFFLGFGNSDLEPLFSIDKYLDFVIAFVLPFGAIFELPLVIVILAKLGFVTSAFLRQKRKLVIFMTFVVGAVISPTPDVFSQSMIAIPMILLYEISLFIVRYILRK